MPKTYTVNNPKTGKPVTFDWNDDVNAPTPADLEEVFAAAESPEVPPIMDEVEEPSFIGKAGNALGTVFDYLGRPGAATAGAVRAGLAGEGLGGVASSAWQNLTGERRDDFDKVLGDMGYEPGLGRSAAGFVGDVVLDPTNLIPGKMVAGAVKPLGKAIKVGIEAIPGIENVVSHAGLSKFEPRVAPAVGEAINYRDQRRLLDSTLRYEDEVAKTAAKGAALNPAQAAALKTAQQGRIDKFSQKVATEFGSPTPAPGLIKHPTLGAYVPPEIAADIDKVQRFSSRPDELDNVLQSATKLWKTMATSVNPPHHFMNLIGNMQNAYLSGVDAFRLPDKFVEAARIVQDPTKMPGVTIGHKTFTGQDLYQLAKEYQVVGDASMLGELAPSQASARIFQGKYNPINPDAAPYQMARKLGTKTIEEPSRMLVFLDRLRKGESPEQAALAVKKYLFDYSELTGAERQVRDYAIPFYTWMRKNIPLQLESIVNNPRRMERLGDFVSLFENAANDPTAIQPEAQTDEGYVLSPFKGEGGSTSMMRLGLPAFDVNKVLPGEVNTDGDTIDLLKSLAEPLGTTAVTSLGPIPKIMIEQFGTGEDLRTGFPIETSKGYQKPSPLAQLLDRLNLAPGMIDTYDGRMQRDNPAYWMRQVPAGQWLGRALPPAENEVNNYDQLEAKTNAILTMLGMTPKVLTPQTDDAEIKRRLADYKQRVKKSILLEP